MIVNRLSYPDVVQQALAAIDHPDAVRLLEGDLLAAKTLTDLAKQAAVVAAKSAVAAALDLEADLAIADARYRFAHALVQHVVKKKAPDRTWTQRIDGVVLNRFLGIPFFLGAMYLMFFFAINIGGAFQDFLILAVIPFLWMACRRCCNFYMCQRRSLLYWPMALGRASIRP